jgi:hypothetical protein
MNYIHIHLYPASNLGSTRELWINSEKMSTTLTFEENVKIFFYSLFSVIANMSGIWIL